MAAERDAARYVCVVCAGDVEAHLSAECNWCDGRYHLNPRNDVEGKDCGRVWIDEQYLALQYACDNCLATADAVKGDQHRPIALGSRRRRYRRRA